MGIDVWFERPSADRVSAGEARADPALAREQISRSSPLTRTQPLPQVVETASAARSASVQQNTGEVKADPTTGASSIRVDAGPSVDPFVLVCVRGTGVLLLTRAPLLKSQQRMAQDIVQAMMRVRRQLASDLQVIEYRYPPAADLGQARVGSPDRALRAFLSVQRQTAAVDAGASGGLILITRNAQALFRDWLTDPHQVVGDLAGFAGDATQKRALWLQLSAAI